MKNAFYVMLSCFLVSATHLCAQGNISYKSEWTNIKKLQAANKPKAARTIAKKILVSAKREQNSIQIVKSILAIEKYNDQLEINGDSINISLLLNEIKEAPEPAKSILENLIAGNYQSWYADNAYELFERTALENQEKDSAKDDFQTWDAPRFKKEILFWALQSIHQKDVLKDISVRKFTDILDTAAGSAQIRPTLYDLLAHRAIGYLTGDYDAKFPVDSIPLLNYQSFLTTRVETMAGYDTTNFSCRALSLYHDLEKFHENEANPLVILDLERLEFLKGQTSITTADKDYYLGLLALEDAFAGEPVAAMAGYKRGEMVRDGYRPDPKDSSKFLKQIALDICDQYIKKFPHSIGGKNCAILKAGILKKNISITINPYQLPDKAVQLSVQYTNTSKIYYRVVDWKSVQEKILAPINKIKDLYKYYASLPVLKSGTFELPLPSDYEEHKIGVAVPELSFGKYIILVSNNEKFSENKFGAWDIFNITQLKTSLVHLSLHEARIYVYDAQNGAAIDHAEVIINSTENLFYGNRKFKKNILFTQKSYTNSDGYVNIDSLGTRHFNSSNYNIKITNGKDKLDIDNYYFYVGRDFEKPDKTISNIYTDRAIYRPGQTVFYNGIIVKSDYYNLHPAVIPDDSTTVRFLDVNQQEIGKQSLKTNAFGSFTGSFVIPSNVLNGEMTIKNGTGTATIQVEEYKRPKFEISFRPNYQNYRLNDSITVEGDAVSYAGSQLDHVKVSYKVSTLYTTNSQQLAYGEIETDEKGHFLFRFKAIPFKQNWVYNYDKYYYQAEATVLDISGETHTATTEIAVAKKALTAGVLLKDWNNKNDTLNIWPKVMNAGMEPATVTGTLIIDKLREPDQPYWDQSPAPFDQYLYDEKDFTRRFPLLSYKTKNQLTEVEKNWLTVIIPSNINFGISPATMRGWPQGNYKLTYTTKDSFGNIITAETWFKIYDDKASENAINQAAYVIQDKITNLQPGQKARIFFGTALKAFVHVIATHADNVVFESYMLADHGKVLIEIPISAKDLGGIKMVLFTSVENHPYRESIVIDVPFPSRELQVKTTVFHSTLSPGQKETWTISIKGPDAQKVSAEIMATLYDASLDNIAKNSWDLSFNPFVSNSLNFERDFLSESENLNRINDNRNYNNTEDYQFDDLNFDPGYSKNQKFRKPRINQNDMVYYTMDGVSNKEEGVSFNYSIKRKGTYNRSVRFLGQLDPNDPYDTKDSTIALYDQSDFSDFRGNVFKQTNKPGIIPRKNLQELAFFYPQLQTNDNGEVNISFTMPEALTRWHFMALAHTKNLMSEVLENYTVTQKEIMVQPNAPRFLREDDALNFTTKVSNMTNEAVDADVKLELVNPVNEKIINNQFGTDEKLLTQRIHINAKGSSPVSWSITIPKGIDGFMYRVTAATSKFSDGEEGMIPVLPARIMVTESMPMFVRGNQTKTFDFKNISRYKFSPSLTPYRVSMEMTSNPAWYAIQALPYLMEFPHECNEQLFDRVFANTVAKYIVDKEPKIKEVFAAWAKNDGKSPESNLEKNEDVKNILLNETPWVRDAENETERKKRIGLLFNDSVVNKGLDDALTKLEKNQLPDGSFPWFPGMQGSRYITGYICEEIGRLEGMRIETAYTDRIRNIGVKAFIYMDKMMKQDYDNLVKSKQKLTDDHLTSDIVIYLYARTFWKVPLEIEFEKPLYFWLQQAANNWQHVSLMDQAMLVSALKRQDEEPSARKIWNSLDDRSLHSDEMGMYWKENTGGYGVHQEQIQTQAMLIEAYNAMLHTNLQPIEEMKLWLLQQKQTHNWSSTMSTADAIYCLLLRGKDPIATDKEVEITMGDQTFDSKTSATEAGTGYFSHVWQANDITPRLGEVKLEKKDDGIAWGAVHFQYYQELDKIKNFSGPINIKKEVYLQENSKDGPVLKKINDRTPLKTGDLVTIRIEIRTDRDMEYIHLKDLRAGALEPVDQISGYKYSTGLGYYQEIKDASMNFFFDHIAHGTYVFEYNLRVTQTGTFQNGIATIENMYAPEFKSHSDGEKIEVK